MAKRSRPSKAAPVDPSTIPGIQKGIPEPSPQTQAAIAAKRVVQLSGSTSSKPNPAEFTVFAKEGAEIVGISNVTLMRWADKGVLDHIRKGLGENPPYYFRRADLEAIADRTVQFKPATPADDTGDEPEPVDVATNPVVGEFILSNPAIFRGWNKSDFRELYSHFGTGGAVTAAGVEAFARHIVWKRKLREKFDVLLETEHAQYLETIVEGCWKISKLKR